jgi:hypothetical protein
LVLLIQKNVVTAQVQSSGVHGSRFKVNKVKLMKERLYECGIRRVLATEFRGNSMLPCKCEESKASNLEPLNP